MLAFYIHSSNFKKNQTKKTNHQQTPQQLFSPTYSCNQNSHPAPSIFCVWLLKHVFIKCSQNTTSILIILVCCPSWRVPVLASTFTLMQNKVCWFFSLPINLVCNNGKQPLKHTGLFLTQCHLTTSVWMRKYTFPATNENLPCLSSSSLLCFQVKINYSITVY